MFLLNRENMYTYILHDSVTQQYSKVTCSVPYVAYFYVLASSISSVFPPANTGTQRNVMTSPCICMTSAQLHGLAVSGRLSTTLVQTEISLQECNRVLQNVVHTFMITRAKHSCLLIKLMTFKSASSGEEDIT